MPKSSAQPPKWSKECLMQWQMATMHTLAQPGAIHAMVAQAAQLKALYEQSSTTHTQPIATAPPLHADDAQQVHHLRDEVASLTHKLQQLEQQLFAMDAAPKATTRS